MAVRKVPEVGQTCECNEHPLGRPPLGLGRIFYDKGEKFCYEWWCEECRIDGEVSPMDDGWPTGADGRFMTAVHCPTIPGLE